MKLFGTFDVKNNVGQHTQQGLRMTDGPIEQFSGRYQIAKGKEENREVDGQRT